MTRLGITGMGVVSAIGQGKAQFTDALLKGEQAFDYLKRPGRFSDRYFLGAELKTLTLPHPSKPMRHLSLSAQAAIVALNEAWEDARLSEKDPTRIGLIIGGSNIQQRELCSAQQQCKEDPHFIRPHYAMTFMDSDLCGICTEWFGIKGMAYTVGGASASGQLAIIQGIEAVLSGRVDICIALGALMDISYFELQAFYSIGAMGSARFADTPAEACRPFDNKHDGFIFGESCGAVVIERIKNSQPTYAEIAGWGIATDAHRNPDPSLEGESRAIQKTLESAGLSSKAIDYINPHGTGSKSGDAIELSTFQQCGLSHANINATKSLTGHGLSAAGCIEFIATALQMKQGILHPTRNLNTPIRDDFNWVVHSAKPYAITHALNMSIGFGGINTCICLRAL